MENTLQKAYQTTIAIAQTDAELSRFHTLLHDVSMNEYAMQANQRHPILFPQHSELTLSKAQSNLCSYMVELVQKLGIDLRVLSLEASVAMMEEDQAKYDACHCSGCGSYTPDLLEVGGEKLCNACIIATPLDGDFTDVEDRTREYIHMDEVPCVF